MFVGVIVRGSVECSRATKGMLYLYERRRHVILHNIRS